MGGSLICKEIGNLPLLDQSLQPVEGIGRDTDGDGEPLGLALGGPPDAGGRKGGRRARWSATISRSSWSKIGLGAEVPCLRLWNTRRGVRRVQEAQA